MPSVKSFVAVRLIIPFIIGLLIGHFFGVKIDLQNFALYFTILILIVFLSIQTSFTYNHRFLTGIILTGTLFGLGICRIGLKQENNPPPSNASIDKEVFIVEILSKAEEKKKSYKYEAKILQHADSSLNKKHLILYVSKKAKKLYDKEDKLFINSYVNRIASAKNPHMFDYQKFMNLKGVFYQTYLDEDAIVGEQIAPDRNLSFIERLKDYCFQFIENFVNEEQQSIAKALLIGYKTDLSNDTSNEFVNSGTMHILAVSGLHVGIIYLMLIQILGLIKRVFPISKYVSLILLLIGIWVFALLTGAKPSVLRAATMFSFLAIGKLLYPQTNTINILAITAFILLLMNPFYLFDVGFQLSFSAVFGIVVIVPLLQHLKVGNKILDYFIAIVIVSFAAQIATLPFSIYYFNIYPTYSLLANILAIPLAFLIVSLGFVGILLSKISILASIFGFLVSCCIQFLQWNNQFFSNLDFSVINGLYLTSFQVLFAYLSIYLFVFYFKNGMKKLLFSGLSFLFILISVLAVNKISAMGKNNTFIYATKDVLVVDEIYGRNSNLNLSQELPTDVYRYNIAGNHRANYIVKNSQEVMSEEVIVAKEKTIQFIDKKTKEFYNVDLYVITEPTNTILQQEFLKDKNVIVANRNRPDYLNLPDDFYFLQENGYYRY